jgi:extradiol dioxygenase family protein
MMANAQFHIAFPVHDLAQARAFYVDLIGCTEGRSTANHVDFDMFGHHVVAHLAALERVPTTSEFDGRDVPIPHFGLNLDWLEWHALTTRLEAGGARFRDRPHIRHAGRPSEHATLFVFDPSGNALEFKAFRDPRQCFAVDPDDLGHDGGSSHIRPPA